jgi:hypothetical protein
MDIEITPQIAYLNKFGILFANANFMFISVVLLIGIGDGICF